MKDNWWIEVDKFNNSGLNEQIVIFKLPKKTESCLRILRVELLQEIMSVS